MSHEHLMIRVHSSAGEKEGFIRKMCALLDCDYELREKTKTEDDKP